MRRLALLSVFVALPLFATFSGTDVFVGAVGRGPGAAGSDWYTSVWIHNPGAAPAGVTAYLLLRNPWANAHRVVVREEKPRDEQGYYLAPEVYGQPLSRDAFWAKHPELIHK